MYEITETTKFITERVDGTDYNFRPLTPYDRLDIIAKLKAKSRIALVEDLDGAGLDKEQRFSELANFRDAWNDQKAFIDYVNSEAGGIEIAALALGEPDADKSKAVILGLRPREGWAAFKAALCNLDLVPAGNPANPQTPPGANANPAATGQAYGT